MDDDGEPRVTFVPQLFLQRRAWALDVVRREKVISVLDVGCGEGSLIACLANPASCLAPTSSEYAYPDDIFEIHLAKVAGFDVDIGELNYAVKSATVPDDVEQSTSWLPTPPRWVDLQIKIWHGGLESANRELIYNPETGEGYECIISTEVIEHLAPEIFPYFAYMLLGKYHPRILAITTPNYSYNARFEKAATDQGLSRTEQGYPDPTGRTDRVFRHDDHKFEWTTEEFTEYCQTEAKKYGYTVEISGVGRCMEGGDTGLGYASLCALFKRDKEVKLDLAAVASPIPAASSSETPHVLLCEHTYTAHTSAGKSGSHTEIIEAIKGTLKRLNEGEASVHDLWNQRSVSVACGGRTEEIYKAIKTSGDKDDKWSIKDDGKKWETTIKWGAFVKDDDPWQNDVYPSDEADDWEDIDEHQDLEESYVGGNTFSMKLGATELFWNTAELEASMQSWSTQSSASASGGWGHIEEVPDHETTDPEWSNGWQSRTSVKK